MKTSAQLMLTCICTFFFSQVLGQVKSTPEIDSLKKEILATHQADSMRAKAIYKVTDAYTQLNPDSAWAYANAGLKLATRLQWKKGIAGFYNAMGMLYSDASNYKQALNHYNKAVNIYKEIGHTRNLASTLNNIGSAYQRQGNFVASQKYHLQALTLVEQTDDLNLQGTILNNIAHIFTAQRNFNTALAYHRKALKTYQKMGDDEHLARVYSGMGNVYHEMNDTVAARKFYNKSIALYKKVDNPLGEATVLSYLGLLYDNASIDLKMSYLLQAQRIFDATDPLYTISITNLGNIGGTYADVYLRRLLNPSRPFKYIPNTYDAVAAKAKEFLSRVITLSKQAGDKDNLSYFSDNLAQLQEKTGDYKLALQNYKLAKGIDDSLYSQESKNKIAELTAQYQFQKKETAYKQQQQLAELKMRQIYLYGVLAVVVISALMIFLLNRSRIGQLRLKNELQRKEAEEKTRELLHQNKLSESELKAIRAQMNPHFIFNVLNSIESYILENDPKMACRLVQKFASLSRIILENSTQSLVTAEREWKALQLYTELEAMRFNNQFTYNFYADPLIDLSALLLPPMLIQPLIENSIHHGLRNSPDDDKQVTVRLEQTEHELLFTIEDNGIGIDEKAKPKTSAIKNKSIGLSAIRDRISLINTMHEDHGDAEFEIHSLKESNGKGTVARLKLPKLLKV